MLEVEGSEARGRLDFANACHTIEVIQLGIRFQTLRLSSLGLFSSLIASSKLCVINRPDMHRGDLFPMGKGTKLASRGGLIGSMKLPWWSRN